MNDASRTHQELITKVSFRLKKSLLLDYTGIENLKQSVGDRIILDLHNDIRDTPFHVKCIHGSKKSLFIYKRLMKF